MRRLEVESYIGMSWSYDGVKYEVLRYNNFMQAHQFQISANNIVFFVDANDVFGRRLENIHNTYINFNIYDTI